MDKHSSSNQVAPNVTEKSFEIESEIIKRQLLLNQQPDSTLANSKYFNQFYSSNSTSENKNSYIEQANGLITERAQKQPSQVLNEEISLDRVLLSEFDHLN